MKDRPIQPLLQFQRLALSIEVHGVRAAMADLYQRISRSLRNNGFVGTLDRIVRKPLKGPEEAVSVQPAPFDLIHGTNTGGFIYGEGLSTLYGPAYIGSS